MSSFVLVFVPFKDDRDGAEAAWRQHVGSPENFEDQAATTQPEIIEDAEQLPLWRWFTF
jgi:hypothetical protein